MKKIILSITTLVALIILTSCEGNSVKDSKGKMRVINASSIAGNIGIDIDYQSVYATNIQYLNYSLFREYIANKHKLQIKNSSNSIIIDTAITIRENTDYTSIVYDSANTTLFKFVEENFDRSTGSFCKVRFLHLSNNAPATDITKNSETTSTFTNYTNGVYSPYTTFPASVTSLNARPAGSSINYYSSPTYDFKAGLFYTIYLKGNIGSTGVDSIGMFMIENNGDY